MLARVSRARHVVRNSLITLWAGLLLPVLLVLVDAPAASAQGSVPTRNPAISVAVQPGAPDRVLAGTLNAPDPPTVFATQDGGLTWLPGAGLPAGISIAGLAFDPQNPRLVLAGDAAVGRLFRSDNAGAAWSELTGLQGKLSSTSAIGELYSAVEGGTTAFYVATRFDGALRSVDGGNSWAALDAGLVGEARRVRELAHWRDRLWAATHDGVYRLDGASWARVAVFPVGVIAFSIAPHGDELVAGTGLGLYTSRDGDTWSAVPGFPQVIVNDVHSTGDRLVAATDGGLYVGSGGLWQQATLNGAPYASRAIALSGIPRAPRSLYAGTELDWVLRSDDGGLTFYSAATMPRLDVAAALATPTPTATPTPPPTATPTETPTATPSPTPTATPTETSSPTPSLTPTETPTPAPNTPSPTPTDTPAPTATPSETPTPTLSPTPSETPVAEQIASAPGATSTSVFPADLEAALATVAPIAPAEPAPNLSALPAAPLEGAPPQAIAATPTLPVPTAAARAPFDFTGFVASSLPVLLAAIGLVALALLIAAAVGILRGPRDI